MNKEIEKKKADYSEKELERSEEIYKKKWETKCNKRE